MKPSSFLILRTCFAFITLFSISISQSFAQGFQRLYGTSLDNTFSKVIKDGTDYYTLGQDESTNGALPNATVTYLDANGMHQWTLRLDIPSVWNDAVLTPSGNLLVVGNTLPFDATNKSLLGLVTPSGGGNFTWVRTYDVTGREGNYRIVQSPVPQNPMFPYYEAGAQFDANGGSIWDDITLMNINESGVFNWKKRFPSVDDDEFARNLDVLSNGDLILAGNLGTNGVIIQIDNSGALINGVSPDAFPFTYADVSPIPGGGFYAVGTTIPPSNFYLLKYNSNLGTVWDSRILGLTAISQVWTNPVNGNIYITGSGNYNGLNRGVLVEVVEISNSPVVQWVKFLDNAETSYSAGNTTFLPPNQIAFVDGRIPSVGGFGQMCAFLSVSDLDFETCITDEEISFTDILSLIYNSPFVPEIEFFDFSTGTDVLSAALNWQQEDVCMEPCHASFVITPIGDCGHYQVTNTSTGTQPLLYQWCNGSTSQNLNVMLPCGPHTFCLTITDAFGCTSTAEETITVTDNTPPVAVCVPPFGVELGLNCEAINTPAMIDGGSSDNCQIQSISVSPSVLIGCDFFPVTLTVTDWCGNTNTCVTTIQTIETTPPVISCPANVIVTASTATPCSAIVNGLSWLSVSDNCGTPFVDYVVTGATSDFGQNDASGLTYNEGVSTVTYTATDDCGNTATCNFDVIVNCKDTCYCGTFTDMVIRFERGPGVALSCGTAPVTLPCPPLGYNYTVTGKFQCQGNGCSPNAPLNAQLEQPDGTIISLGNQLANPYFGVSLANLNLHQMGVYTITLTGQCGTETCTCIISFIMDPPCVDVCPCEPGDIHAFLLAGFQGAAQVHSSLSCKVCFTPNAYGDCESVNWWLDSVAGSPIGVGTGGNQSFCYTFPGPGTYTVYMVVTRINDDGTHCHTLTIPQSVVVTCGIANECISSSFENPSFSEGAVAGGFQSGGMSRGWTAFSGEPEVIEGAEGSSDGWSIVLSGNLDTASTLTQFEYVCLEKIQGFVTLGIAVSDSGVQFAKAMKPRPCDKIQIQLYQGDQFELNRCNSEDCFPLASISLAGLDTNEWHKIVIPYDLSTWTALDDCGGFAGVEVRPVIYLTNALSLDQGGEDTYSLAQLDDFCFNGTIVGVNDPPTINNLRIYPNPGNNEVVLELDTPASHNMSIRIVQLTGQALSDQQAESGKILQHIEVDNLPVGIYFLQVIHEGRATHINKFVKL